MKTLRRSVGISVLVFGLVSCVTWTRAMAPLTPRVHEVLEEELKFGEPLFDAKAGLLVSPNAVESATVPVHRVRESGWHALGLLLRHGSGDDARAIQILDTILKQQISAPGEPWDGTFRRYPEEPPVPHGGVIWRDYDPNWRQFIGTTFALVLIEFPDRVPDDLRARMLTAIGRAADGEQHHGRLKPSYTNIALMHAFLCSFAGERLKRPDLSRVGAEYTEAVNKEFRAHNTFEEFNSPTYYGVDFYGLGLWRAYGPTERMRTLGAELEAELWRCTAAFYHAGLRNLCGPYDRSYGMDMTRYVALTGLWLRLVLDEKTAPFPKFGEPMDHVHDVFYAPCFAILGAQVPSDALDLFKKFPGERSVTRTLPGDRTATAWLGQRVMIGGEVTGLTREVGSTSQLHPGTIHWLTPTGQIGWCRVAQSPRIDAKASPEKLEIVASGDLTFRISSPGLRREDIQRDTWKLAGLDVAVNTDAKEITVTPGQDYLDVTYSSGTRWVLNTKLSP